MTDDHDREFSVADLSVQIFTVPSLVSTERLENTLGFRMREVRPACPWIGDTCFRRQSDVRQGQLTNLPLNVKVIMEDGPFEISAHFPTGLPGGLG